jgi:carboxymethylenebutenolidase
VELSDPTTYDARSEIDSLQPPLRLDRRGFVKTTDTQGLTAGEVKIPTKEGEGAIPAYRAQPAGKTGLPVVLVVSEIFGVHEHIKDVTRRLAKQGYLAIAPELFARQGDATKVDDIQALVRDIVAKTPDSQVMADLDAAAAWAAKNGGGGKLGITGFCWGGRAVWMYAAHNPNLAAGVAWYGSVARSYFPGDKAALDVAASIKAPVLGLYGGADGGIPNDTLVKMRAALKAAGNRRSEIVVYPDTPHAFHSDYRPSYRKEQAEDGWKRMSVWMKHHLGNST